MYALVDCNNFFVSCERVFNPSLQGKPVVVLSNNDGCIISRSNEAKALGIKMGQPLFEIDWMVKRYDVKIFSSNFALYGDMSDRVMNILRGFAPSIEVYSIDEAFIDLTGVREDSLGEMAAALTSKIKRETGIPVSVGVSKTKTLAKVAAKLCKSYPALKNSCYLHKDGDIDKVHSKYPIEEIWGIGRRHSKRLKSIGVNTAKDFISLSPTWVRKNMAITGLKIYQELKGVPSVEFENRILDKQSICTSRSFAKSTNNPEELILATASFAANCASKLRYQDGLCGSLTVFMYTNRHRKDEPQCFASKYVVLDTITDSTITIARAACRAAKEIYKEGYSYKKCGVIIGDISKRCDTPALLFNEEERGRDGKLMKAMDRINSLYGRDTIVTAAQGIDGIKANKSHTSPLFTTSWDDIIKVKL